MNDLDLELSVTAIEGRLRQPLRDHLIARWRGHCDGTPQSARSPAALEDPALWRRLESMRGAAAPSSLVGRRIEMLWRLVTHAVVAGDPAVASAEAAVATAGPGLCADRLGRLFEARNQVAQRLGRSGFYPLGLELAELDPATTDQVASVIDRATRDAWRARAVSDPTSVVPARPRPEPWFELSVRIDHSPTASLSRTYLVSPPDDVRVVIGRHRTLAEQRALGHELGHACYAAHHDPALPWPLADAPARCLHEAVAELCADAADRLVEEPGDDAEGAAVVTARRRARLSWRRWQLARFQFERDGYARPDGDLAARFAEAVERWVGPTATGQSQSGRRLDPKLLDADREHFASDPMSQVSYLVGDYLRGRLSRVAAWPRVGDAVDRFLIDHLFRPGAVTGWRDRMAVLASMATGVGTGWDGAV